MTDITYLNKNPEVLTLGEAVDVIVDMYLGRLPEYLQTRQATASDQAYYEAALFERIHFICQAYLQPLIRKCIRPGLQRADSLTVTDFPFICRPANCSASKSVNGILCLSSGALAFRKAILLQPMHEVSAAEVNRQLAEFARSTVVSEPSPLYLQLLAGKKKGRHQLALSTLFDLVAKAIEADPLVKKSSEVSKDRLVKMIMGDKKNVAMLLMVGVHKGLNDVLDLDEDVDTSKPGFEGKLLKTRQRNSAGLLKSVDHLLEEVAQNRCTVQADGSMRAADKDLYGLVAALWHNHKKNFMLFLDDPHVSPDIYAEDNKARPFKLFVKNIALCNRHQYCLSDLCTIYSVLETVDRNDRISDNWDYLISYFEAVYMHIVQKERQMAVQPWFSSEEERFAARLSDFDYDSWNPMRYRN